MIKYIFPYGFKLGRQGKILTFPSISAYFESKTRKKIFVLLLIDSGAETTLLTRDDANALGIELKEGKETTIAGIAPVSMRGYRHKVEIEIEQIRFKIPVLFADSNEVPRVLGREGIFEHFYILFNEKARQTIFILHEPDSQRKLKTLLNNS